MKGKTKEKERLVLIPLSDEQIEYVRREASHEGRSFRRQVQHCVNANMKFAFHKPISK